MGTSSTSPRSGRFLRWGIAAAVVSILLAVYWVTLDRVATRIGQDAENTFRTLPVNGDSAQRAD